MDQYKHSVSLDIEKCKGCTNCLKRCPTEAIRIRDGHAVINSDVCIDCGECIRRCPYQAKKANFDKYEEIDPKKYRIALPAPSFYGQFAELEDVDYVLQGLLDIGFNEVFEVARAAEIVTEYTRRYMKREDVRYPVINSACPVVVRLITLRFPYLCDHVIPMMPPIEVAGRMAREEALQKHPELKPEDIAVVFISPCPAKASYVKNGFMEQKSNVDYVVSMSDIYFKLIGVMKKSKLPQTASQSGMIGMSWASTGGEASALLNDKYLAADGIENVIRVLDEIETGHFPMLQFVELNACPGGCVGGVATVENPYIARVRMQALRRYLPVSLNRLSKDEPEQMPKNMLFTHELEYRPVGKFDEDRALAMQKMSEIEALAETLPALDCGSCGAPTCRAFAEDVVLGGRSVDECIVYMRERIQKLAAEQEGEQGAEPPANGGGASEGETK
ncbi:MAG TPA: [Fe-Fe] hydrogenase large subunit C-terminal domain-containing protein [Candidatus Cryosericum sp.]|nr:[Fe-Fe] hydrogenase large subunit C-terminal domain-containing protein [Candidatus Cryosericum sp.]